MNENQVRGRTKQAKGKGKEVVGKAVGDKQLQREGTVEQLSGEVEVGRVTK